MKSQLQKTAATRLKAASTKETRFPSDRSQRIALAAYFKAEARGFIPGHELDDWLEAEREVMAETGDEELAA
ncbi:MAG: DUF2934 domain-containing protein [Thiobacillaceae bacterium]